MLILAVETVTRRGSIAVGTGHGADVHARAGEVGLTHAERLPGELTDWLAVHGRTLGDIDRFAVVTGPGSFTGLRAGIAAVQGLALAGQRSVIGVPTLDALATAWLLTAERPRSIVVPCLDGQRGEVFVAAFDAPNGARSIDVCTCLIQPRAIKADEAAALLAAKIQHRPIVFVGDGGLRYSAVFEGLFPGAEIAEPSMTLAEAALRIAAEHPDRAATPDAVQPVYLRRPDAVILRERAAASRPAPAPFVVRSANSADLAAVEALQRQTFTNPWGAEAIRWELENTDVARLYIMQAPDGELVAYCACWMVFDELHINSLAVGAERRRQGLARQLLDYLLREAIQAGARSATLEVRSSNLAARALYDGLGFKVEGVRRDYYQDPREDAIILWNRDIQTMKT